MDEDGTVSDCNKVRPMRHIFGLPLLRRRRQRYSPHERRLLHTAWLISLYHDHFLDIGDLDTNHLLHHSCQLNRFFGGRLGDSRVPCAARFHTSGHLRHPDVLFPGEARRDSPALVFQEEPHLCTRGFDPQMSISSRASPCSTWQTSYSSASREGLPRSGRLKAEDSKRISRLNGSVL